MGNLLRVGDDLLLLRDISSLTIVQQYSCALFWIAEVTMSWRIFVVTTRARVRRAYHAELTEINNDKWWTNTPCYGEAVCLNS